MHTRTSVRPSADPASHRKVRAEGLQTAQGGLKPAGRRASAPEPGLLKRAPGPLGTPSRRSAGSAGAQQTAKGRVKSAKGSLKSATGRVGSATGSMKSAKGALCSVKGLLQPAKGTPWGGSASGLQCSDEANCAECEQHGRHGDERDGWLRLPAFRFEERPETSAAFERVRIVEERRHETYVASIGALRIEGPEFEAIVALAKALS